MNTELRIKEGKLKGKVVSWFFHTSRPNDWNPASMTLSGWRSVGRAYFILHTSSQQGFTPSVEDGVAEQGSRTRFSRKLKGLSTLLSATWSIRKRTTPSFTAGFTILFAVLIGSLLLSIGLFISHLSVKEIMLATAGRNSETAFFAADTGIECALYWDFRIRGLFPSSDKGPAPGPINCNGNANTVVSVSEQSSTAATSNFTLQFTQGSDPAGCALVSVKKTVSGSTIIESRGRNECGLTQNPARVERALRARY